jgi:hypothetical protein
VRDLTPGYIQLVTIGDLSPLFPRVGGVALLWRAARGHAAHFQGLVLLALVGDLNCVISQMDTENQAFIKNKTFSQKLFDIKDFLHNDAFHVLIPV